MYVPIALASMWWGFWGLAVAGALAALVVSVDLAGLVQANLVNDLARVAFFPIVAFFIGQLRRRLLIENSLASVLVYREDTILFANRRCAGLLGYSADGLAGRNVWEEQLVHSTRLAELGEMAAAISHELNQPLTGIRNYARNTYYKVEQKMGSTEEVKENLRLISEQVDRAARISTRMRELTRRSDRHFVRLDLNSIIRESVDFLLPQMKLAEVEVALSLDPQLPEIRGNRIRLSQVFLNLLTNARQAMEACSVRKLAIRTYRAVRPDLPVVAQVVDTGKGFSAEEAANLFRPFYTTKKSGHGTGLGLSLVKRLTELHQGKVSVESTLGTGSAFTVHLPLS